MNVAVISDYPDVFYAMTDVTTIDTGSTIVHEGAHPELGRVVMILNALDTRGVVVMQGA